MHWCFCTGRIVSIRDYSNLPCIDAFVLAGLYRSVACNLSCIDFFVLAGLYRSVTIVMYHILVTLYWHDYIDPWLLQFIMYWFLCTGRSVSIRDYCNLSCIDVFVPAGLYRSVTCDLSCIHIFVLARLYRSVTFVIYHVLISLWRQDYVNPWLMKCILCCFFF